MGFSRQEYWSGLYFLYPIQGSRPLSLITALAGRFFTTVPTWEAPYSSTFVHSEINNFFFLTTYQGCQIPIFTRNWQSSWCRQSIEFCEPCFLICEIEPREGHDRIIVGIKGLDCGERLVQMRSSCSDSPAP